MILSRVHVEGWFNAATLSPTPPDLIVDQETPDLLDAAHLPGLRESISLDSGHDPGCYLFYVERGASGDRIDLEAVATAIERSALGTGRLLTVGRPSRVHDGERGRVLPIQSQQSAVAEDSRIVVDGLDPVLSIGPGGHVFLEERDEMVVGTSSVRTFRQTNRFRAWVQIDDVMDALEPFMTEEIDCRPAFGYFEASWLERQNVIQPRFSFLMETDPTAEYPEKWVVTVPATTGPDVEL
jgi:hypothetical protein